MLLPLPVLPRQPPSHVPHPRIAQLPSYSPTGWLPPSPPAPADILDGFKVGDSVQVEVLRGGQRKVLTVQLAERQPTVGE